MESDHRVSRIPHEICDMILDHLQEDDKTLVACALTCRAWLPRSRNYLWKTVVIYDGDACMRLAQILDASPHLSLLVHELVLYEGSYGTETEADGLLDEPPLWMDYGIPRISGKFPVLQSLELDAIRFDRYSPVATAGILALASHVTELSIAYSVFQDENQLRDLLGASAGLMKLSLHDSACENDGPYRPSSTRPPIPLQSVHLASLHVEVINWLFQWRDELRIQRLNIVDLTEGITEAAAALLSSVGDALQHLEIGLIPIMLTGANFQAALDSHFSLQWNTRLRSLSIDVDSCQWLPTLLAQISSTELIEITLNLPWRIMENPNDTSFTGLPVAPDWDQIDRMLTCDKFARLKCLTVLIPPSDSKRASWMDCLQIRLPRLFARSLLNVVPRPF